MFDISPFYFYKVIEILIRAEDSLSRDVVKHLNHVSSRIRFLSLLVVKDTHLFSIYNMNSSQLKN